MRKDVGASPARDPVQGDAPGRVNLMGEHTDYHQGFVLPMVIPQRTSVTASRRPDRRVRVRSAAVSPAWASFELGDETRGRGWLDYVQGVTAMLAEHGFRLQGFDAEIASNIPLGAGVSSSAALEVSLLRALRGLLMLDLDDLTLAKIAQTVETRFVGAPVGIMDQMASSLGRPREALFIDTRVLAFDRVPLPSMIDIVVIDSGISHAHAGGEYATRRRESFEAAKLLGVAFLRDADLAAVAALEREHPLFARRARHVISENSRVLAAVGALRAGDGIRLGQLFQASHASMRDDYETSTPEIDRLVDIAAANPRVFGARLTGGGFGGAVVIAVESGSAGECAPQILERYRRQSGGRGEILVPVVNRAR